MSHRESGTSSDELSRSEAAESEPVPANHALRRAIICLILLGGSVSLFGILLVNRPMPPITDGATPPQRVPVVKALLMEVPRQWTGFGIVEAVASADVPARVGATVLEIPGSVLAGAQVSAGDLLILLDESDFARAAEAAQEAMLSIDASLTSLDIEEKSLSERLVVLSKEQEIAQADVLRVSRAFEQGVANEREVEHARKLELAAESALIALRQSAMLIAPRRQELTAKHNGQQAALARAQLDVTRCRIVSPLDGVLQRMDLEVGEAVAPGSMIARVVDPRAVEVAVALPASARESVRVGDEVQIVDGDTVIVGGQVARVNPEDDSLAHTMTVWVDIAKSDASGSPLAPKSFVEAIVVTREQRQRTVVPRRSVRGERVFVVESEELRALPVVVAYTYRGEIPQSGLADREWLVLELPLPSGTLVALDGTRNYQPGAKVLAEEPGAGVSTK